MKVFLKRQLVDKINHLWYLSSILILFSQFCFKTVQNVNAFRKLKICSEIFIRIKSCYLIDYADPVKLFIQEVEEEIVVVVVMCRPSLLPPAAD